MGDEKKRKRVRAWRLRHLLPRQRRPRSGSASSSSSSDSDSTGSDSSTTSSGSSSSRAGGLRRCEDDAADQKRQRREPAQESEVLTSAAVSAPGGAGKGEVAFQWFNGSKRYRCFALAPAFLTAQDIENIESAAKHCSVKEINDRKGYLAFKHRVWRFELQLRALYPAIYSRLMELMCHADEEKWRRLRAKSRKVYPEVEFIEYDVDVMGEQCFIEPHVDNKSAVTMVAMLSQPGAYVGGLNCFRRGAGRSGHRQLALNRGDVVLSRREAGALDNASHRRPQGYPAD